MTLHRQTPESYPPGAKVPLSGIYLATHLEHRPPHEILAIAGEELPHCRTCGARVSFELVRGVDLVTHDMDFAGPSWPIWDQPSTKAA